MNSVCKSLLWLAVCLQLLLACLVSARPQHWEDGIDQQGNVLPGEDAIITYPLVKQILNRLKVLEDEVRESRTLRKRSGYRGGNGGKSSDAWNVASKLHAMRERPDWNGLG